MWGRGYRQWKTWKSKNWGMDSNGRHSIREGGKMGAFCYVNFRISSTAKIKVNLGKLSMWLPVVEPVPVR
jgi:hypothetical protein